MNFLRTLFSKLSECHLLDLSTVGTPSGTTFSDGRHILLRSRFPVVAVSFTSIADNTSPMASSMWYCTVAALWLPGTSAARKYLSMRMNQRSTSEDCVSASGGIIQSGFSEILPCSPILALPGALSIIHDTGIMLIR
ncbi:hypothetical protein T02_16072 [Trichinella nativa]|uniref:Uncharacterized protein n=1 Tax=Trichinella nativa TaxID=6335 RepID=A0A0V1LHK4_9BILA|nr:hypothetical protein T02_16072 [Trichinella nativa]